MASEPIQGFGSNDDPLNLALAELEKPGAFSKMYDGSSQRHDNTLAPIVSAMRMPIGEVQSLRDEVEDLRRERDQS